MEKLLLTDLNVADQKVLVRVDFNVPQDRLLEITDDSRIKASLPTIKYLLDRGSKVILMSHLGKPNGKYDPRYSLETIAKRLEFLIGQKVYFAKDCIGKEVETLIDSCPFPSIILLENLRFYEAEEDPEKDPSFVQKLAHLAHFYINDAFGTAHRNHASTALITKYFPNKAASGFLMQKEIEFLGKVLKKPQKPFFAVIGGSKVSSKLGILKALLIKADALFIGGAMSYTFLKALGYQIGDSLYELDLLEYSKEILQEAKKRNITIHLPIDLLVADAFKEDANYKVVSIDEGVPVHYQGMGIGPKTSFLWAQEFKKAKTLFWNGPVGVYEFERSGKSTQALATAISNLKAITIAGGGDSMAVISKLGLESKFSHVSTGGGASLEYIEQGYLPGIEALSEKK